MACICMWDLEGIQQTFEHCHHELGVIDRNAGGASFVNDRHFGHSGMVADDGKAGQL